MIPIDEGVILCGAAQALSDNDREVLRAIHASDGPWPTIDQLVEELKVRFPEPATVFAAVARLEQHRYLPPRAIQRDPR